MFCYFIYFIRSLCFLIYFLYFLICSLYFLICSLYFLISSLLQFLIYSLLQFLICSLLLSLLHYLCYLTCCLFSLHYFICHSLYHQQFLRISFILLVLISNVYPISEVLINISTQCRLIFLCHQYIFYISSIYSQFRTFENNRYFTFLWFQMEYFLHHLSFFFII